MNDADALVATAADIAYLVRTAPRDQAIAQTMSVMADEAGQRMSRSTVFWFSDLSRIFDDTLSAIDQFAANYGLANDDPQLLNAIDAWFGPDMVDAWRNSVADEAVADGR